MGETNGNHRSIFRMRSTAAAPPSRGPRGRTGMAMPIAGFLVAVMMVTAMALASMAGTGLARAQTDRDILVLQRRIAKYVVLPFVFGCVRAIVVGSSHHVVRFKLFANIPLPGKPSL